MAQDLHEVGVRVEELLAELRAEADPAVHERAEALVSLLVEFYGENEAELRSRIEAMEAALKREKAGYAFVREFDAAHRST